MPIDDVDDYLSQFGKPSKPASPGRGASAASPADDVDDYLGQFQTPAAAAPKQPKMKPVSTGRAKEAAELIRSIEGSRERATSLFKQADQADRSTVATGNAPAGQMAAPQLDSMGKPIRQRDLLRAQAEGELEKANTLARSAEKRYSDLIETGFGRDIDPNSRRQWAYAKPRRITAQRIVDSEGLPSREFKDGKKQGELRETTISQPAVEEFMRLTPEQRARLTRPEEAEGSRRQQRRIREQRERYEGRGTLGRAAERVLTEYLSGDPGASPAARQDLAERRAALGISDDGTVPEGISEAARQFGKGALGVIGSLPRGLAETADILPGLISEIGRPIPGLAPALGRPLRVTSPDKGLSGAAKPYTDLVERALDAAIRVDPKDEGWFTAKIPQAVGSAAGFAAGGGIGRALGASAALTSGGVGALSNIGAFAKEMDAAGVNPARRDNAIALAGLTGATEAFGLGKALDKFGLKQSFLKRLVDVAEEGGQENVQGYLEDVNAAYIAATDPNRNVSPLSRKNLEGALIGAIVGSGFQGVGALAERLGRKGEKSVGSGATPEAAGAAPPVPIPGQPAPAGPQPGQPLAAPAPVVGPLQPNTVRVLAPGQSQALDRRDRASGVVQTFTVTGPDGSPQQVEALVARGMRPELAQLRVEEALRNPAPPVPEPPVPIPSVTPAPGSPTPGLTPAQQLATGSDILSRLVPQPAPPAPTGKPGKPPLTEVLGKLETEGETLASYAMQADPAKAGPMLNQSLNRYNKAAKAIEDSEEYQAELLAIAGGQAQSTPLSDRLEQIRESAQQIEEFTTAQKQAASPAARRAEERAAKDAEKAQQKLDLFDEAQRLADESRVRVEELTKAGDTAGLQNELRARQRSLKDALKYAPESAQGLRAKAQINRDIDEINTRLKEASRQAKARPQNLQTQQPASLLDQVTNPEGGVPAVQEVVDPGSNFIRLAAEQKPAREEGGNLLKAIRRAGGIRDDGDTSGELRRLGMKEAGTSGLMNRKGSTIDRMREMMVGEGLSQAETVAEFYDEIEAAMRTDQDRRGRQELTEDEYYNEQASAAFEISPRPERMPGQVREQKTVLDSVEADPGDVDPEDIQYLRDVSARSQRENPRDYRDRTRPGEPGSGGVSFSPYNVLVSNNQSQVDRLYDLDLRSDEARGIAENLRQYSLDNNIELKHLHALLDYVRNYQIDQASDEDRGGPTAPEPGGAPPALLDLRDSADFVTGREYEVNRGLTQEVRALPREQADWVRSTGREIDELLEVLHEDSDMMAMRDAAVDGSEDAVDEFIEIGSATYGINEETLRAHIETRRAGDRRIRDGATRERDRDRPGAPPVQAGAARGDQSRQTARTDSESESGTRSEAGDPDTDLRSLMTSPRGGSTLSAQDFKLLSRPAEEIPDTEIDDHIRAVEDLRNRAIRGSVFGGVDLSAGEARQVLAILRTLGDVRTERREAGRVGPKNPVVKGIFEADLTKADPAKIEQGIKAAEAYLGLTGGTPRERAKMQSFLGRARAELAGRRGEEVRTVRHPDPALDGAPVLGERGDGRVIVLNPENKTGISVVKDRTDAPAEHKSSSTQVNLPKELADKVRAFAKRIPEKNLTDNGREDEPHITVKYGLYGSQSDAVREILEGQGPIRATLGKISLFQNEDFDVVKIDVESRDLARLHEAIKAETPNTETFPEYQPHVTIAYVKKGKGRQFVGDNTFAGQKIEFDRVLFSGREGNREQIPTADSSLKSSIAPIKISNDESASATTGVRERGAGARGENRALEPGRSSARRGQGRGELSDVQPGISGSAQPADRPDAGEGGRSRSRDRGGDRGAAGGLRAPGVPGAERVGNRESAGPAAPGAARSAGAELPGPAGRPGRGEAATDLRTDQPGRVDPGAPTVAEKAKEAGKEAVKGLDNVAKGLGALFGGQNKLSAGFTFDENTYAQAKPYFEEAFRHFWASVENAGEVVDLLFDTLKSKYGFSEAALDQMEPYVQKFAKDMKSVSNYRQLLEYELADVRTFLKGGMGAGRIGGKVLKSEIGKAGFERAQAQILPMIDEYSQKFLAETEAEVQTLTPLVAELKAQRDKLKAEMKGKTGYDRTVAAEEYERADDSYVYALEDLRSARQTQKQAPKELARMRKAQEKGDFDFAADYLDYDQIQVLESRFKEIYADEVLIPLQQELALVESDPFKFADKTTSEKDLEEEDDDTADADDDFGTIEDEATDEDSKPQFVADAEARLRDVASGKRAGSGGQALLDQAIVNGYQVYKAGMDFTTWSKEVIAVAGRRIRPHLRDAWNEIQDYESRGPGVDQEERIFMEDTYARLANTAQRNPNPDTIAARDAFYNEKYRVWELERQIDVARIDLEMATEKAQRQYPEKTGADIAEMVRDEENAYWEALEERNDHLEEIGGASRTEFSKPEFVREAEKRLKEVASGKRAGSGAEQLFDMAIVAGYRVYRAGMDFAQWSSAVIKEVGREVRPHLQAAWDSLIADTQGAVEEARERQAEYLEELQSKQAAKGVRAMELGGETQRLEKIREILRKEARANQEAGRPIPENLRKDFRGVIRQLQQVRRGEARNRALTDQARTEQRPIAREQMRAPSEEKTVEPVRSRRETAEAKGGRVEELKRQLESLRVERNAIEADRRKLADAGRPVPQRLRTQLRKVEKELSQTRKDLARNRALAGQTDARTRSQSASAPLSAEARKANLGKFLEGSKVKKPLYHGSTSSETIDVIDPSRAAADNLYGAGFYMTEDPDVAAGEEGYAMQGARPGEADRPGASRKAYKLFANISNPFDVDGKISEAEWTRLEEIATKDGAELYLYDTPTSAYRAYGELVNGFSGDRDKATAVLKKAGYDGITHAGGTVDPMAGAYPPAEMKARSFTDEAEAKAYAEKIGGKVEAEKAIPEGQLPPGWSIDPDYYEGRVGAVVDKSGRSVMSLEQDGSVNSKALQNNIELNGSKEARAWLKNLPDSYKVSQHRVWIAFNPTQVKSATGNKGTYSSFDPSIMGFGFGALQGMGSKTRPIPNAQGLQDWEGKIDELINSSAPDELIDRIDRAIKAAKAAAGSGNVGEWNRLSRIAEKLARRSIQPSVRGRVFETIGSAQTAGQLGSAGFLSRNILQHGLYGVQSAAVDRLSSAIDRSISAISGTPRTIVVKGDPFSGVKKDLANYKKGIKDAIKAKRGGNAPGQNATIEIPQASTAIGQKLGDLLFYINQVPDSGNYELQFNRALESLTEAATRAGKTSPQDMEMILDRAKIEADRNTFRDENFISKSLGHLRSGLNSMSSWATGTDKFGLGDIVMKYTKTPANLLKRTLEYTPVGLIESAYHAGKAIGGKTPYARREAIESFSKVIIGSTSGMALGAGLAALGVLVVPNDDDLTSEILEGERGVRDYSLNLNALVRVMATMGAGNLADAKRLQKDDLLIPIGWAQPWALQASLGAAMYKKASVGKAFTNNLGKALEIMGDESVAKNIGDYWEASRKGKTKAEGMEALAAKFLKDAVGSFTPSTLRSVGRAIDPYTRDFRPEDRSGKYLPALKEGAARAAAGAIPGLSRYFPTRDSVITGEEKRTAVGEMGPLGRVLSLVAPVLPNRFNDDPFVAEVIRLNEFNDPELAKELGEKTKKDLSLYVKPLGEKETEIKGYQEPTSQLRERENAFARQIAVRGKQLVTSAGYQSAGDKEKLQMLGKMISDESKATQEAIRPAIEAQRRRESQAAIQKALQNF